MPEHIDGNIVDDGSVNDAPTSIKNPYRLDALDLARGLIMIVMAIDHASALIAKVHFSEFWGIDLPDYNNNLLHFFTRYITHICAPGFFLFMGVGMVWFRQKRMASGWSERQISSYFVKRGIAILLIHQFIELPLWAIGFVSNQMEISGPSAPGVGTSYQYLFLGVLFSLALSMIIWGLLIRLHTGVILTISIAAGLITQLLVPDITMASEVIPSWQAFLWLAGRHEFGYVFYPILPWLFMSGLGLVIGRLLFKQGKEAMGQLFGIGIGCLIVLLVIKFFNGFGNLHTVSTEGVIEFLRTTKYPPSLTFLLFGLGTNLILLSLFSWMKLPAVLHKVITVFGRTAMFFYLAHLLVYGLLAHLFPYGLSIGLMYPFWLLGLAILYPVCSWYIGFKKRRGPKSLWRYI